MYPHGIEGTPARSHAPRMPTLTRAFHIAMGTLVRARCGDCTIESPAVWKLAELLRLADYLKSAAESKLTVLRLGVSEHAIEGTHTRSDASCILSLDCTLQIAVGTPAQVRWGDTAVKTRSGRRTSTWRGHLIHWETVLR